MAKSTSKLFKEDNDNKLAKALNVAVEEEVKQMSEEMASDEVQKTEVTAPAVTEPDDIQDVELSAVKKQRFRFNHDNSKILELNTSDLTIITRLSASYERLNKIMEEVGDMLTNLPNGDEEEISEKSLDDVSVALKKLDDSMRQEVDSIFDAPVSAVLCSEGSMYDPIDGMFRYEHIIDKLSSLYENNLNREFGMMRQRVNNKTSKYTKKYHN